jgi:hypothetical protein
VPELNQHALRKIHDELPANCACGVSTNRTCEIGLTAETGRTYRSIAYLLEECSRPKPIFNSLIRSRKSPRAGDTRSGCLRLIRRGC